MDESCKYNSKSAECQLYQCINNNFIKNFKISKISSFDFGKLADCFPETINFNQVSSDYIDEQEFKDFSEDQLDVDTVLEKLIE